VMQLVYSAVGFEPRAVVHRDVFEVVKEIQAASAAPSRHS